MHTAVRFPLFLCVYTLPWQPGRLFASCSVLDQGFKTFNYFLFYWSGSLTAVQVDLVVEAVRLLNWDWTINLAAGDCCC